MGSLLLPLCKQGVGYQPATLFGLHLGEIFFLLLCLFLAVACWGILHMIYGIIDRLIDDARDIRHKDLPRIRNCRGCGYDLRGSRGRCPECGRVIPPPRVSIVCGHVIVSRWRGSGDDA